VVLSYSGWQTHAVTAGAHLRKLDPANAPISTAVGVLGMPGFTAYAGLLEIGRPKAGETVVVAAATGPVGSAVGQIAKVKGARAVGIAGEPDKCKALLEEFGRAVLSHTTALLYNWGAAASATLWHRPVALCCARRPAGTRPGRRPRPGNPGLRLSRRSPPLGQPTNGRSRLSSSRAIERRWTASGPSAMRRLQAQT
jgi:hypothetical protein